MSGLPIHAVKFFWGLYKSASEECNRIGGSIDISRHLVVAIQNILEDGFQRYLVEKNHDIEVISMCHEMMVSSDILVGWFFYIGKCWSVVCCKVLECECECVLYSYTTLY